MVVIHPPMLLDSSQADSLMAADSAAVDSIGPWQGIVIDRPTPLPTPPAATLAHPAAASWIMVAVLGVTVLVCARMRVNLKFFKMLLKQLVSVKERGNLFDETVRETSFIVLLNALNALTIGLLLYCALGSGPIGFAAVCIGLCALYALFMPLLYGTVGLVFSDREHTTLWVRGFLAGQALLGLVLLPGALVALFNPETVKPVIIGSLAVFGAIKLIFIIKGFRIFFFRISSWVVFLYYLCTLETLPLLMTCSAAMRFAP